QDRRVRQELPLVADEEAEQPELVRRQLHRLAAEPHRLLLEVDAQLPDVVHGLGRRLDAAHRGTQARKQLLDAEGLRHVVVGARVERGHLLALVADDRKNDDGDAAPRAQLAADVGAASVRQDEIENDGVGRRQCGRGERSLGRVGSVDVVARAAQARLQRAQDVRLVIHHQDATAHARTAGCASVARASTKWPPAGSSCVHRRPPFASANPRAMASPRLDPPPAPRWNGWKIDARSAAVMPGPRSTTWMRSSVDPCSARTMTGEPGGEKRSAFSMRLARTRSIWPASTRTGGERGSSSTTMR